MREVEISIRDERYKEKAPLPKIILMISYVTVIVLLIFTVLAKNHLFLFFFLTLFSTIVNYHFNMLSIRICPQPEVMSALLLAKIVGFHASLLMLIFPVLFVDIYTARLDKDTLISLILTIMISFLMSKFLIIGFVFFAVLLITLKFIIALVINLELDISPQEILFEHVLGFIVNLVIILAFGGFFFGLFSK